VQIAPADAHALDALGGDARQQLLARTRTRRVVHAASLGE
jgi:hypothetical protein